MLGPRWSAQIALLFMLACDGNVDNAAAHGEAGGRDAGGASPITGEGDRGPGRGSSGDGDRGDGDRGDGDLAAPPPVQVVDGGAGADDAGSDAGPGPVDAGDAAVTPSGQVVFVGVGNWGLRGWSGDAVSWAYCGLPAQASDHTPELLRNIAYGDGVFIAVGGDANSMVMRSVDGEHWEADLHPTDACPGEPFPASCTNWMGAVAYGDGVWLAGGGNGAVMRSLDAGRTWAGLAPDPRPNPFRDMVYAGGRFIAVGDGGNAFVSDDAGESWTVHNLWPNAVSHIAHGGGALIAWSSHWTGSALERMCAVSVDLGDNWSGCDPAVGEGESFAYDGARWLARIPGGHAVSLDGQTWTTDSSEVPGALLFADGAWYGRQGGNVLRATSLDAWQTIGQVDGFRAWVAGTAYEGADAAGVAACEDRR